MVSKDEVKRALGGMFVKDLERFEPGKQGIVMGEYLRVYTGGEAATLRFLLGTPASQRQSVKDRLRGAKIEFTEEQDFRL